MWDDGDFSWMNDLIGSNSSAPAADTGSVDWSSILPQTESYGYDSFANPEASDYLSSGGFYGGDLVGERYSPEARVQSFTIGPDQTAYQAQYGQQQDPYALAGVWDLMQSVGRGVETPGGKLGIGLLGAGVSAFGANKANKQAKEAYKKQQALLAARQAKAAQYDSPLRLASARQAVAAPQARRGETEFFSNNRIPAYFADGGGVTDEDYARMQQEAMQAQLDARMDRPSAMGFLRYIAAGKRMPSEIAAARRAQQPSSVIDVIQARRRAIDEASGDNPVVIERACGGSTNYVEGGTAGQDDKIPAQLSDGEYVMDADVVSALGDGNNAAGAAKLDQMREGIRAHKRSAPANKIPPKAKSPLAYMKKGKK